MKNNNKGLVTADIVKTSKEANKKDALNYPRRAYRTIDNVQYELAEPTVQVSRTMQKIGSSNTSIELMMEEGLKAAKISFTKPKQLIENIDGNPDFVIPRYRIAIFCDGDFWHGFNNEVAPKSNGEFWKAKIQKNIQRDQKVNAILKNKEWKVFRFWEHDIKKDTQSCVQTIKNYISSLGTTQEPKFTFVDLFSGIGGFRIALEELGGKCLGFSEIDKPAIQVYKSNFCDFNNDEEVELGDITKLGKLPFKSVDLIVGGVPCQSWSVAGKMRGFEDPRGRLWHDTIRVVELNEPKAFIFENVKGLMDPRNKANLDLIENSFRKIGYSVRTQLLNSHDFGLPQNRDRVFLVGIKKSIIEDIKPFLFPEPIRSKILLTDIIEDLGDLQEISKATFTPSQIFGERTPVSRNKFQKINELNDFFVLCDTRNGHTTVHSWDIIKTTEKEKEICMTILRNRRKKAYGNADGNPLSFQVLQQLIPKLKLEELEKLVSKKILRIVPDQGFEFVNSKNSAGINGIYRVYLPQSDIFSTLTATGTKDMIALKSIDGASPEEYKQTFIDEIIRKKQYRSITGKESGRLQGFPGWFSIHNDEALAKKQFGNAVSTLVIYHLGKALIDTKIFDKSI